MITTIPTAADAAEPTASTVVPAQYEQSLLQRYTSRKFVLAVLAVIYSVVEGDPKYGAVAAAIYALAEGLVDYGRAKAS